jgi:hypothetical protein
VTGFDSWVRTLARGSLAGLAATTAMSAVMLVSRKAGLMGKLPPERITERALRLLGVRTSETSENALSTVAHLGYGAGVGALFAAAGRALPMPVPGPVAGVVCGLAVWTVSYAGWIPALGIMPPPHRDRRDRQASMIVAHLVYGAVLGTVTARRSPGGVP